MRFLVVSDRFLLALSLVLPLTVPAQVQISAVTRGDNSVTLSWQGGYSPCVVETSPDLVNWSDQGEPAAETTRTLSAFDDRSFYRVTDLNPADLYGRPFGLIQTEQGEFGSLMARHRLKTRLWLYLTKAPPHTSPSYTPANYWRKLFINYQHLEQGRVRTWAGALEDLGTVATPSSQRLTVTWTIGSGASLQKRVLTLDFPYPVNVIRTSAPFPSDPTYELKSSYATPQPEFDPATASLKNTSSDSVNLVQMSPANDPAQPDQSWHVHRYRVAKKGVQVNLHFFEGLPLRQGNPPWILKTYLLDRWLSSATGGGGTLPAFSTDSYFSLTLLPGHHNFWAVVLVEPALDPAIAEETRAALLQANIRQIYTVKDLAGAVIGGDAEDILYFGHDNTVRHP